MTIAEVYVDHISQPRISLVWDKGYNFYVGGIAATESDYAMAADFLREKFVKEQIAGAKVYFASDEWQQVLLESLHDFTPNIYERSLFIHDFNTNPAISLDSSVLIKVIDKHIVDNKHLANVQFMIDEIVGGWGSTARFLERGFGCCAIADERVAGWCTAEYVSRHSCGIGIETVEEFQNQGIATAMASSFVDKCKLLNLMPHWDSWKNNIPSIRVAEKQGFQKVVDYKVVLISKSR
jgi:RimJ/RimL family protein N-acetyltransferase